MPVGIDYDVHLTGPMFDGRAVRTLQRFVKETDEQVGKAAVSIIQRELDVVLRHPTGHYRSSIKAEPVEGRYVVTDSRVIYGPWLEGVGSRNSPVTRFKGYATFRRMLPRIKKRADLVASALLRAKYIGRL